MLTNSEYAYTNRVPADLSPEMSDFALFTIELSDGTPLWSVTSVEGPTITELRRIDAEKTEEKRQENLARYVAAGHPLFDGDNDND